MSLSYKSLPFVEVKATGGDGSIFEGYCAVFNNVDSYGDIIVPGAFTKTLPDFLESGQICYDHGIVIGKPLEAREDAKGLFVKGRISDTTFGRDAKTLLADGVLRKMSIGYRTIQRKQTVPTEIQQYWTSIGYTPTALDLENMRESANYLQFLYEVRLFEASPVGFPANRSADITGVKSGPIRLSKLRQLMNEVKAGRALSAANRGRLAQHAESLRSVSRDLDELLAQTAPETDPAPEPAPAGEPDDPAKSRAAALHKSRAQLALIGIDPIFSRNSPR